MSDGIETFDAKLFHLTEQEDLEMTCVWMTPAKHQWIENKRCWTYFPTHQSPLSHLLCFIITHFRSESLFSYLTAPSVTFHSCKPAQQHMRWHVNKSAFAWEMCLRFLAGAWTSLHHAHIYTLTQHSVWYIVYTTCIHSAYSYNKCTTSGHSNTLMWHRYAVCIHKDNG